MALLSLSGDSVVGIGQTDGAVAVECWRDPKRNISTAYTGAVCASIDRYKIVVGGADNNVHVFDRNKGRKLLVRGVFVVCSLCWCVRCVVR